jgi:hypothetical protein
MTPKIVRLGRPVGKSERRRLLEAFDRIVDPKRRWLCMRTAEEMLKAEEVERRLARRKARNADKSVITIDHDDRPGA